MSNFIEKIGEKLHIGGHKKEGEHEPHAAGHVEPQGYGGHTAVMQGSHPDHGYGAEHDHDHDHAEAGHIGAYAATTHNEHGDHHEEQVHGTAGAGVPPPHHEGPLEKVKNKIKGKKHDGGGDSSSSSESDGEGGRRKKKHGIF